MVSSRRPPGRIHKVAVQRRSVDLLHDKMDFEVAMLASLGFSTEMIMQHTGYSFSQVTYRLHKAGVKRMEYRNGTSPVAQAILEHKRVARPIVMNGLQERLAQLYSEH
jgi:hypothetical protein